MNILGRILFVAPALAGVNASSSLRTELAQSPRQLEASAFMAAMYPSLMCSYENNWDFVGNDIGNRPGQSADCCALCSSTYDCHAFTWTDYNGGTCWLKRGRGAVVWKEKAVSALVLLPFSPKCQIEASTDYVGNDIGSAPASVAEQCCVLCEGFKNCRAFSWNNYNGGTCWFKSSGSRRVVKEGVTSASAFDSFFYIGNCGLEQGVDFVGNDIGNTPAAKPEECCAKCSNSGGCRAFSWTNHNGGTCWLKNLKGDTVANPNAVSSVVFSNPTGPVCSLEIGVDYAGNDIGNAQSADAYGCCSICMRTDGCKAFSWSSYNGGTCWLKSAKGSTVIKDGVKSSIIVPS